MCCAGTSFRQFVGRFEASVNLHHSQAVAASAVVMLVAGCIQGCFVDKAGKRRAGVCRSLFCERFRKNSRLFCLVS